MTTIRYSSSVEIRYVSTLDYYDGILLFEAQDSIGGSYLATILEMGQDVDTYLMVRCRPDELRLFKQGEFELRQLFERSAQYGWFRAYLHSLNEPLTVDYQTAETIPDNVLPEPGFRLDSADVAHEVARTARQDTSVVLQVVIDPREGVSAAALGTFLNSLQQFLNHIGGYCEGKDGELANFAQHTPRSYDMAVSELMAGSAKITLDRRFDAGLGGDVHPLTRALSTMHELFSAPASPQFIETLISTYGFRVAQSYLQLLLYLRSQRTGLTYTWASPLQSSLSHEFLTLDKVDWLAGALDWAVNKEANFYEETTDSFVGKLVMADLLSGRWRLDVYGEPKVISGKVNGGIPKLETLILNNSYKFDCIVKTPRLPRKRTLYVLTNISPV